MKIVAKSILVALATNVSTAAVALELGEFNDTKFSIGGYIKAGAVINSPDSDAAFDAKNTFNGSVRQSRINFKTTRETDGHNLTGFIEGDFFGGLFSSSSYSFRLRHAYLKVDNITVGQTWNGQFFATAPFDGEMINFWGLGAGTISGGGGTIRPNLSVHYVKNGFRITAQDPVYSDANYPDMVASYTKRLPSGSAYNVALTGREVQNGSDSDLGAGVSIAGKLALGKNDIRASVFTGEGMGVYSGVGVGGAYSPNNVTTLDAESGKLVRQTGFAIAYKHQFSTALRGTIRYGEVKVDDAADSGLEMTNINMIYSYLPGLDVGIEWRKQSIDTLNSPAGTSFPNHRPKGNQFEIMAKYTF